MRAAPCVLLLGLCLARSAWALDFLSVAEPTALYDAPSSKAKAKFVALRDTPLEAVSVVGAWVKVRDAEGDLAWAEKSALSAKRTVQVRAERAEVRAAAAENAPLVFEAERRVVLDLLEVGPPGWVRVRHRDGQTGFAKALQLWGL